MHTTSFAEATFIDIAALYTLLEFETVAIAMVFTKFLLTTTTCEWEDAREFVWGEVDYCLGSCSASSSLWWRSAMRTIVVVCARLLEGFYLNRQLWVLPRSSTFYQDNVQEWSNAKFKFLCVSANLRIFGKHIVPYTRETGISALFDSRWSTHCHHTMEARNECRK